MQQAAEQRPAWSLAICCRSRTLASGARERGLLGLFAGMFLPLVHFLDEGFGLFLIGEGKGCGTLFELERVEESAILIVGEAIVYLLVPNDPSTGGLYAVHYQQLAFAIQQVEWEEIKICRHLPTHLPA